jgi:hypothetical protein
MMHDHHDGDKSDGHDDHYVTTATNRGSATAGGQSQRSCHPWRGVVLDASRPRGRRAFPAPPQDAGSVASRKRAGRLSPAKAMPLCPWGKEVRGGSGISSVSRSGTTPS